MVCTHVGRPCTRFISNKKQLVMMIRPLFRIVEAQLINNRVFTAILHVFIMFLTGMFYPLNKLLFDIMLFCIVINCMYFLCAE